MFPYSDLNSSAAGGLPAGQNHFQTADSQGSFTPQGFAPAERPFPYPYPQETENAIAGNSFEWYGTPQNRQLPRPPQPGGGDLERRVRQLERQQDRFGRELNQIDRRLRIIERRFGIPVPPVPFPGTPPR
ncbi:hypothetical protein [Sporolactobacillus pectinivorans]|uniref:hypothetical protein n=1 Tax=Sporolactobacillus pectinivorans TaxID=1591408 RepID=UPI000C266C19|nr:hypothetical protein [Sporolactobacillus pectinivorans]